jgi:hypothetical protein
MIRHFFRRSLWAALAAAAALAVSSCGDSTASSTPTTPSGTTTSETFSDTLTPNGAKTHTFTAAAAGLITATLTTLAPDSTAKVGLSLGTWNGSQCQLILSNDTATQGTQVTGNVSTTSALCVRIADSTGTLTQAETYTITVSHP